MTAPGVAALLGLLAAIAVACVAMVRARDARAALAAAEERHRLELATTMEAGSRLAGDVAHDLNDLLTAITGHTELLIASLDPSGASIQDAHEIRRAALSAARLTRPLRQLGSGRRASGEVLDVNAVTARTIGALERMLGPRIEITLALDNTIDRIRMGAAHLDEIVLNLGIHARDAMPDGGRLRVATTMHTLGDRHASAGAQRRFVRLIMTDSSAGMSKAAQARLFEPFLATDDAAGSAMGLARVEAIVKEAGGRLQVESTGAGTTFTIDLPATSEAAAADDPPPGGARVGTAVLVVEDDPRVRELIVVVLARAGYEVVAVAGARAALDALKRQTAFALMLVDVVMPEMDGYDLMTEARKLARDVQVVFMSGFACDPARHPSGDGFLAKPFTVESLTAIVQTTLARQ